METMPQHSRRKVIAGLVMTLDTQMKQMVVVSETCAVAY